MQQLQAVEAPDARCVNGHFEEGLVDPVVFAAVVRLVHALHAAARAIATLDRGLRLALEAPEVEVLLERTDEEVVDDVAEEAGDASMVVGGVDEPAHETDLERHVPVVQLQSSEARQTPTQRAHLFVKRMTPKAEGGAAVPVDEGG